MLDQAAKRSVCTTIQEPLSEQAPDPHWQGDADWTGIRDKVDPSVKNVHGKKREEEIETGSRPTIVGKMVQKLWIEDKRNY